MGRPDSVIRLDKLESFPAYVAVYSSLPAQNPFILSPQAMQWSESVVLYRLDCCQKFWSGQLKKMQCDTVPFFAKILSQYFGDDYIAVFGIHPWQCLMYLYYLQHQKSTGVFFLQNRLNRNIFKTLGWKLWFEPQKQLITHLESLSIKGFNASNMRSNQQRLMRFLDRVGINGPFDIRKISYQSFSRRFTVWPGKIWQWTLNETSDLQGFPWISLQPQEYPVVSRDLEYPVNIWEVVESLLTEDLYKLSEKLSSDKYRHTNRIRWQIRLFNQQLIEVDLSFRHPYSLHRDRPDFSIALYQARYGYDDLMRQLQLRDTDLDLPECMPLLAWKIEISEQFDIPPLIWDMFASRDETISHQAIIDLQNKLSVVIESYDYACSFYADQTFKPRQKDCRQDVASNGLQWSVQSLHRPLFYYPSVQAIEPPYKRLVTFLDRSVCNWWQYQACQLINRDYFILKDGAGRLSWIYRDFDGSWFKQGEYC